MGSLRRDRGLRLCATCYAHPEVIIRVKIIVIRSIDKWKTELMKPIRFANDVARARDEEESVRTMGMDYRLSHRCGKNIAVETIVVIG